MDVSIIYVSWNSAAEILASVESLTALVSELTYEVIVVDNASPEGAETLDRADIQLLRSATNGGFGAGCNLGASRATGNYLLFLNPDTRLMNDVARELVHFLRAHPEAGIAGPMIVDEANTVMFEAGRSLPSIRNEFLEHSTLAFRFPKQSWAAGPYLSLWDHRSTREVETLLGACMMIERSLFQKIGGFDERFFLYSEEFDLCRRVRAAGYEVWYVHTARLFHKGKSSTMQKFGSVNRMVLQYLTSQHYYFKKHRGTLAASLWRSMIVGVYLLRFASSRQTAFLEYCKWGVGIV